MLHGSSFGTEKAYTGHYKDDFDVFFGIGRRMKGAEPEEQFNKLANCNLQIAVDTEGNTWQEDKKHTSGGGLHRCWWSCVIGGQQRDGSSENDSRQPKNHRASLGECQRMAACVRNLCLAC